MKIESAIALERKFSGTVSMISVLTGPVDKNNKNIATAKQLIATFVSGDHSATADTGTANKIEPASTHA